MNIKLSIGCSVYDDFHGIFFTIQALRMYHPICNTDAVEFIILDNNPTSKHGIETQKFISSLKNGRYIPITNTITSFNKYKIPDYTNGKYVLILDSHVLLEPDAIDNLLDYCEKGIINKKEIYQGPLLYDDLNNVSTHLDPVFRGHMYGTWATDKEQYLKGLPFEIEMQGMGLCFFAKDAWPGIHPDFRGFGAEEGYIQGKFKKNGGKCICLPFLKWNHRFGRPDPVPYPLTLEDRIYNYFLGWLDIYENKNHPFILEIYNYFKQFVSIKTMDALLLEATTKTIYKNIDMYELIIV